MKSFLCILVFGLASLSVNVALANSPEITAEKTNPQQEQWAEKLWQWADEFQIPIDKLPRKKADLLALTELDLNRKDSPLPKITYLPPEIGKLSQLQKLDFLGNKLQTLPPEIGNLSQLQKLLLHENNFQTLPPEIGNLTQLQELDLKKNNLQTLPPEIGNLTQLQLLWLDGNNLQTLPKSFLNLKKLEYLNIKKNKDLKLTPEQRKFLKTIKRVDQ